LTSGRYFQISSKDEPTAQFIQQLFFFLLLFNESIKRSLYKTWEEKKQHKARIFMEIFIQKIKTEEKPKIYSLLGAYLRSRPPIFLLDFL
jgi:hypothetical protein